MKSAETRFRAPLAFLAAGLLALGACHLKEPKPETVMSLAGLADTLSGYDEVRVDLKDPESGETLETLFTGRVEDADDLTDLPAPGYGGGRILVSISAWQDGELVYQVDRIYDGKRVEGLVPRLVPGAKVEVASADVEILVGQDFPLPEVTVTPEDLADKAVIWSSSDSGAVSLAGGRYRGASEGVSKLTAVLRAGPSVQGGFTVRVKAKVMGAAPDSLFIRPDTLEVALDGAVRGFALTVHPAAAEKEVTWHAGDARIARLSPTGQVDPVRAGLMKAWAVSAADRTVSDTAWVRVVAAVAVTKVDIVDSLVNLVRGGSAESLEVRVEPVLADPAVDLRSKDSLIARVEGGRVHGRGKGETWVYAVSRRDASKRDSVKVIVGEPQRIDSVTIDRDTLLLWVGGPAHGLKALVHPAQAPQQVTWTSSDPSKASVDTAGRVLPGREAGNTVIRAASRQDTARRDEVVVTVRKDEPRLNITSDDTTVAVNTLITFRPEVSQEFGTVVHFEWDLDGDGKVDGVSAAAKNVSFTYPEPRTYSARFLVRDSEGNSVQVVKKVLAVTGRVVNIGSPRNGFITREKVVAVAWTVDNEPQATGLTDTLKIQGVNVIRRSAKDQAGKTYLDSVLVFWDTLPPAKPVLKGSAAPGTRTVTWTWISGGNGGHGLFRSRIDTADLAAMPPRRDTLRSATLADGVHTLYVQERDSAGNWSETASLAVTVDLTPPAAPVVTSKAPITREAPQWSWKSGGQGSGVFRWSLDSNALATAAPGPDTAFTGASTLPDGTHTLYVQERDAAGLWSPKGRFAVLLDRVAPGKPVFPAGLLSPMNLRTAAWVWTSGGRGGNGTYRISLDINNPLEVVQATRYALPSGLPEGNHTLYVQERDTAGNWSETASKTLYMTVRDTVGTPGFSGGARSLDFAFSPSGVPHVALTDLLLGNKAAVMTYTGGIWDYHPGSASGISAGAAVVVGLTFNGGAPMVSYNAQFVSTKTYSSSAWRYLGDSIFASLHMPGPTVSNGLGKYYAISTEGRTGFMNIDSLSAGEWLPTMTAPTAFYAALPDTADYRRSLPDMTLATSGALYVAYRDRADNYRAKVITRMPATAWAHIGTGLPLDSARSLSLALAPDDTPYLVLSAGNKLSAWVFRNNAWTALGNLGALGGGATASLAIAPSGVPYVAHPDPAQSNRVALRAFVNNAWTTVAAGLSPANAQNVRVAVHPTSGVPWVAYAVPAAGRKITVVKVAFEPPAP